MALAREFADKRAPRRAVFARPLQDLQLTALRRYAQPVEIAHMILSLCLPAASYITGAVIPVDGDMTARNA